MAIGIGGALLGAAGLNLVGGLLGADANKDAARIAANASLFRGVPISTGIGAVTPTGAPGNISFETALSPEYQALRDRLLGIGATGLEQYQQFDPMQAAGLFTQQLNAMAMPQEQQARLSQENRLFKQGLLGSTTGAKQIEALRSAQALAQNERNLQGYLQGQLQQDRLFQQALGGIQGGSTIDNLLAQQLNQAIAAGGAQTSASTNAANFQFQAGQSNAAALTNFFSGIGQGLGQLAFSQPQPSYSLFAPQGGTLDYVSGGYGGTGMGVWYQ